jgi:acetyl-CoA synthetase
MPDRQPIDSLKAQLSAMIVEKLGKAYRPHAIYFVSDLPKTRSMKVMRRAVRAALTDGPVGDISSLVNPESLEEIRLAKTAVDIGSSGV